MSSDIGKSLTTNVENIPITNVFQDTIQQNQHTVNVKNQQITTISPENTNESISISKFPLALPNLFSFKDLVQAGELQYIDQNLDEICKDLVDGLNNKHQTYSKFIQDCLILIMYLLKRQQNVKNFFSLLLYQYQNTEQFIDFESTETINLSLRMLIHVLFVNSDIFLQQIIMSLLSKRNPVPLISTNIQNQQYEFNSAIIHVWNTSRPTILSFGIGSCKGKSILLNQLFQTIFEQTVDSIYFQQTIDIDFGYSFNPERILNIADTHGIIDKQFLEQIHSLFHGFLIHIDKKYFEQQLSDINEYRKILPKDKLQIILIRDTSNMKSKTCSNNIDDLLKNSSKKLHIYELINISSTSDQKVQNAIRNLREKIFNNIREDVRPNNRTYIDLLPNLKKLFNKNYIDYLERMDQIIGPLIENLLDKNQSTNEQNFPLYFKFKYLCKTRQELKKLDFYGSNAESIYYLNAELWKLENQLDLSINKTIPIEMGYIFNKFIEILKSDNMLMSLYLLVSKLKSAKNNRSKIDDAFLSLEFLWRNAIVCYDHTTDDNQHLMRKSYYDYISAGFPFEIIDGDNLNFQHQFLTEILEQFQSQRILVISIIGLQNSGKSTLLNYMFGTLFDISDGRCTRGIYSSFVKIDKTNGIINSYVSDIDYLMLIDTEGLRSSEKQNDEYDRRLVLFCLAVSHLVIVNILSDINEDINNLLTLCTDSLKHIGVNKVNQPIVQFVINRKADPSLDNHLIAIQNIIKNIKDKEFDRIIHITDESFHALPSAFRKENAGFIDTDQDFIESTQKLSKKILQSAMDCYKRSFQTFSNLPQWLAIAINVFDTLQKFPDLTYFKDINERRQDDQIRIEIRKLILKKLTPNDRQKMIEEKCEQTENDIKEHFREKFYDYQEESKMNLEEFFKKYNASGCIRTRCKQFFKRQIIETHNAWCIAAIQLRDRKQMERLIRDGAADLRVLIDNISKAGRIMTKNDAEKEFETMWTNQLEKIKNNFDDKKRLNQAINFVYGNYNIFEKELLPSHEYILSEYSPLINQLSEKSTEKDIIELIQNSFLEKIFKLKESILQFSSNQSNFHNNFELNIIEHFHHLDKKILCNLYTEYIHEQTSSNTQNIPNDSKSKLNFRDYICEKLSKEISDKSNETSKIFPIPTFFNQILEEVMKIILEENIHRRPIEIDLVQKIVSLINNTMNEVCLELSEFKLSLSTQIQSLIHILILILLIKFYYDEQKNHFDQQVSTLTIEKSSLLTYFISMIVPDADYDEEGGRHFVEQINNIIISNLMSNGQRIISNTIQEEKNLDRKSIQKVCDNKLLNPKSHNQWLLDYIEKPIDIIVGEFDKLWENIEKQINRQLEEEKQKGDRILIEFFRQIQFLHRSVEKEGSFSQLIDDSFEASTGTAAKNLKNKGQCMVLLLYKYLLGNHINAETSFQINNNKYTLNSKGIDLFKNLPKPNQSLINFIKSIDVSNCNHHRLTVISIKNLYVFLKSILEDQKRIEKVYNDISPTFQVFDKERTYYKLLDKARGCTLKCPCCQRCCDVDHTLTKFNPGDENNRHSCQTGHQLRAMSGIKFEMSNSASLLQCEGMKDDQLIIVRGQRKTWVQFKKDHANWDFGSFITSDELLKRRSELFEIWKKIGQNLCKTYNMKFVKNNDTEAAPKPFHYILLLDASGSMEGKLWENLLDSVENFVRIRIESKASDRLTIIVFDHEVKHIIKNTSMQSFKKQNIEFTSGGTDFHKAFDLVNKTIEQSYPRSSTMDKSRNLMFIIVFMSDGYAEFPNEELDRLLTHSERIHQFWTVALRDTEIELDDTKMYVLQEINKKMNGIFKTMKHPSELIEAYAEIAGHMK